MSLFDIRRRDCLAREGIFSQGDLEVRTPGIIDMQQVSPALDSEVWTNVPLAASAGFVSRYQHSGDGSPVVVHPLGKEPVTSGDLVVVANWHTVLAGPPTLSGSSLP